MKAVSSPEKFLRVRNTAVVRMFVVSAALNAHSFVSESIRYQDALFLNSFIMSIKVLIY